MTPPARTMPWRLAGPLGILVLVAACSSTGGTPASVAVTPSTAAPSAAASASTGGGRYGGGDGSDETAAPSASASAPAAASGEAEVFIGTTSIGRVLTGEDGMTLYTYKPDSKEHSACTGSCAENWPPFSIQRSDVLEVGKDVPGKITTFVRADGTTQLAYDGAPLYYFGGDSAAGDTNGQGVNSVWSVAAP